MLEERVAMNKEVTEASTKKGAYDKKMMEMWRAYNNYELGDNKDFMDDYGVHGLCWSFRSPITIAIHIILILINPPLYQHDIMILLNAETSWASK